MYKRRAASLLAWILLILLIGCAKERPPVERYERDHWVADSLQVASLGGQFAAPNVSFVLRLEGEANRRITVEGTIEINPQAKLVGGRWSEDGGPSVRSGTLSSASIDYFGGQGDRPSLGGQLVLSAGLTPVYRVNLPRTRLGPER